MTKTYVMAVSGGVDSVVLLDIMSQMPGEIIVAHFDHGIREDSQLDAEFVKDLANKYGYRFETRREDLGPGASEDLARTRRYEFLRSITQENDASLVTAHHMDDLVETVAINLTRGTGWRGLAVLDAPDIYRPLVRYTKQDVIEYAQHHKLEWREDPTNSDTKYLRNQLRQQLKAMSLDDKLQIAALVTKQRDLKKQIEKESQQLVDNTYNFSRYFFINIPKAEALECLRAIVGSKLTHPQLAKLLHAIKTMSLGKRYEAGNGVLVDFTTRNFSVELLK